jgi:hypothetical protein
MLAAIENGELLVFKDVCGRELELHLFPGSVVIRTSDGIGEADALLMVPDVRDIIFALQEWLAVREGVG